MSASPSVIGFEAIDRDSRSLVGGKGAHLGELAHLEGVLVPAGFCVTTSAFQSLEVPGLDAGLEALSRLSSSDHDALRRLSAELRERIEGVAFPDELTTAIGAALQRLGEHDAWAVRSSATAEDLPSASFAGQQDTYLNVVGLPAVLHHIRKCWASLFTERAVAYRLRNTIDHRKVQMAVVVQKMVFPQAAGVLFTADPLTGNRKVASVEATFGLGEALVSGLVNADAFKVRDGEIIAKAIGRAIAPHLQPGAALTDADVIRLVQLGRRIEAHFGRPQDIEWCLVDGAFHLVQSRPITTLFPLPPISDDQPHVYVSVGHQQMMTDALKPLGLSMWQLATRPMSEAGGRLFVDVTQALSTSAGRASLANGLGKSDPLIGDALKIIAERNFIACRTVESPAPPAALLEADPSLVTALIDRSEASIDVLKREIASKTGVALFDFILTDLQELKRVLWDPKSMQAIVASVEATAWLNERIEAWLGEKNVVDVLVQSVAGNVTSEMGLALLEVADVLRPYPKVIAFLEHVEDDRFLEALPALDGGREARAAIEAWLERYGARGVGEIDVTRPRFLERPTQLVPMLLGNVKTTAPGEARRRFEAGQERARQKARDLLERLRALPDGARKADETQQMIDRIRTFAGYREYPKFAKVRREFIYKQALLAEAARLVGAGVLRHLEDIFFLRFEELHAVVRTQRVDERLLRERREEFVALQALKPPRVMTSEGEAIAGAYRREDAPAGALIGLPVSGGTVEGRARVILDVAQARLEPGDLLVTAFTDPSWTPLFLAARGLVTEVGGLMTHGSVVAREFGLPAVVGVENATRLIRDGQRIRVNGTNGSVELLS